MAVIYATANGNVADQQDINQYKSWLADAGGGITTPLNMAVPATFLYASGNQLTVGYNSSNKLVVNVLSTGGVSYTASGSGATHAFQNSLTASSSSQAIGAYGAYVSVTSGSTGSTGSAILGAVLGVHTSATRASGKGQQIEFTNQSSGSYGGNNFGIHGLIEVLDGTGSGNLNTTMNFYISRSSDNKLLSTLSLNAAFASVSVPLVLGNVPGFSASDKYLIIDASGNVHKSALGPAS